MVATLVVCDRVDRKRCMVIDMDLEERRARHAEDKARHYDALERVAADEVVTMPRSEILPRFYDDDDYPDDPLVKWKRGMVRAGVWPVQTDEEREQEVREALAKYQLQVFVDGRLDAKLAEHDEARLDAHGAAISHERKRFGKQIEALQAQIAGLELKCDSLMHEATKRQIIEDAAERREHDRGEVIDMLQPLERKRCA